MNLQIGDNYVVQDSAKYKINKTLNVKRESRKQDVIKLCLLQVCTTAGLLV